MPDIWGNDDSNVQGNSSHGNAWGTAPDANALGSSSSDIHEHYTPDVPDVPDVPDGGGFFDFLGDLFG